MPSYHGMTHTGIIINYNFIHNATKCRMINAVLILINGLLFLHIDEAIF